MQCINETSAEKVLLVTTVPETLATILKYQPSFLNRHYRILLACSSGPETDEVRRNEGVPLFEVPMERGISPFKDLVSIVRMVFLLMQVKPDVLHSYTPKAGLVSMIAGFLCRVPIRVHTFTGLVFPTSSGFKKYLLILVDKLICRCATVVVPEGGGVMADLQRFSVTKKPLRIIGHGNIAGVDTKYFSRICLGLKREQCRRDVVDKNEKIFVFCYVGRINRDKGIKELIEAFVLLPESAHLILVGGLDETAMVDVNTLSLLNRHERVHWVGFKSDIRPFLCAANVLVLPSYREGFPNVLLQAGAMELPAIATDIGGCNEIVDRGFNGWLVPARDSKALAEAMNTAMSIPEVELEIMGRNARSRVQERHERSSQWERMRAFYQALLQGSSKSEVQ